MDRKIELLKSTTFADRRFTRRQLVEIQQTVNNFTNLSLRELAHTICENLNWVTTAGTDKIQTCLNALEEMQAAGLFVLPEKKKKAKFSQKQIVWTDRTNPQPLITGSLTQWPSLKLHAVTQKEDVSRWNEFVDRYHYLRYKRPIGTHLRYFIVAQDTSGQEQILGCLIFSYATLSLACRDQWIGWDDKARRRRLNLILNNNRFLILPWVRVNNLASKVLSMAAAQVPDNWMALHGFRPLLMETFVDPGKFIGTCYKAANWHLIGQTKGHKGSARVAVVTSKDVYVYPLTRDCKQQLIDGKKPPPRNKQRPAKMLSASALVPNDPFIMLWQRVMNIVAEVATEFDQQWRVRRRTIDTTLLMLFIFRLVFSNNKQGYGTTIVELWDQYRVMNIPLPTAKPVAQSSFSNARKKLDEHIFKILNQKIISACESDLEAQQWRSHRVFAVDGSKINLPRPLLNNPYLLPTTNSYYPQALVSCLYQLKSKIPYDFDLLPHLDERQAALAHLKILKPQDLVIYDRGYFSFIMLYHHLQAGVEVVFRLQVNSFNAIDDFFTGAATDQQVTLRVPQDRRAEFRSKYSNGASMSLPLRLVKYVHDDTTYVLGTSLLDRQRYSIQDLSELYHARWGVEELYKISKELMEVGDFHAKTDRGVKQELFAHFVLMTMTRIFTNHAETRINDDPNAKRDDRLVSAPEFKTNMKNALVTMARNLEVLLLQQRTVIAETINKVVDAISSCRQMQRPGRKYERVSRRPDDKWKRRKSKPALATLAV